MSILFTKAMILLKNILLNKMPMSFFIGVIKVDWNPASKTFRTCADQEGGIGGLDPPHTVKSQVLRVSIEISIRTPSLHLENVGHPLKP